MQALLSALLRFQGIKLSQGVELSHGHSHLSVSMEDLGECTRRVQETVSSCLKQVGGDTFSDDRGRRPYKRILITQSFPTVLQDQDL